MSTDPDWWTVKNIDLVDTPALIVFPQRVDQNIQVATRMIGDLSRLRPHAKTHKSAEVTLRMLQAGILKFKCATIAEAEMLAKCEATDILLAYQPAGPKIHRLAALISKYASSNFSCLVDNLASARSINEVMSQNKTTLNVYIDLNTGQGRTGMEPSLLAVQLYEACTRLSSVIPVGLHAYDGHIRDKDITVRKQRCDDGFAAVLWVRDQLISHGFASPRIIAGGSLSFPIHAKRAGVECSPGTFIYWDKGYSDLSPDQDFVPAALVVSRVISVPSANTLCLDLGHKSISAENELSSRVFFLNNPGLKAIGQSEEHLVLQSDRPHDHKIGEVFYGMPIHICPTVALYERAITITDQLAQGEWMVAARDRKLEV